MPLPARALCPGKKEKSPNANCVQTQSGGGRWIRTIEAESNRFTVCPLWPLGNSSKLWNCYLLNKSGAGGRTWTPDLLITNQLLYQLSYTSEFSFRSCIHSLISSAYIIYHILHHLSTLFSNFFEAFSFFEDVLEWVSLTIISSSILFVKGFCKKIFHCIFQQNILWIFCRSVAKLQTFRFTAKLNSLLAVRQDNLAIYRII